MPVYFMTVRNSFPDEKRLSVCLQNNIPVSEIEYRNPFLLHGKVGAFYAREKFNIQSEDILNAITYHTTGRPRMSMLEKIVFVADYIEPRRCQAPNLYYLRKAAFVDIDQTVCDILKQTLEYLREKEAEIDQQTVETYEYYKHILEVRNYG